MSGNIYRLLGFFHNGNIVILTNGFQKKTQKIPANGMTQEQLAEKLDTKKSVISRKDNIKGTEWTKVIDGKIHAKIKYEDLDKYLK